jgi:hypothetical protein
MKQNTWMDEKTNVLQSGASTYSKSSLVQTRQKLHCGEVKITTHILTTNHSKTEIGPNSNSKSVATQLAGSNPSHEKIKRDCY